MVRTSTLDLRPHTPSAAERSTAGALIYAIGDVHGRFDLLRTLLTRIDRDVRDARPERGVTLVFLGDLIDRGPASDLVLETLVRVRDDLRSRYDVVVLRGNHEQAMLDFLDDAATGPRWALLGAAATLGAYGVTVRSAADEAEWAEARDAFAARLPQSHLDLVRSTELHHAAGDYLFVHAGVRPGVPLEEQDPVDLLTIRGSFLQDRAGEDVVVVHGHSARTSPDDLPHRIGVDTGAYATGVLTAVRLDGAGRTFLDTRC